MRQTSVWILAFGAIAISQSSEVHEQKVLIQSAPTHVVVARPVPITVAEIIENAKGLVAAEEENVPIAEEKVIESPDDEGTKITKRWWKDESPPAPPPAPMGWGWPSHGGGGYGGGQGGSSLVGPFAFQLGAYYNPYLPVPLQVNGPSYGTPQARPTSYSAPATSSYSPSSAPAQSSYSAPAPSSYSSSSSYSAPAATSSYSAPASSSYSAPASPSYSSGYSSPSYGGGSSSPSYGGGSSSSYGGSSPSYGGSSY